MGLLALLVFGNGLQVNHNASRRHIVKPCAKVITVDIYLTIVGPSIGTLVILPKIVSLLVIAVLLANTNIIHVYSFLYNKVRSEPHTFHISGGYFS